MSSLTYCHCRQHVIAVVHEVNQKITYIRKDGGLQEITLVTVLASSVEKPGSGLSTLLDIRNNLVVLSLGNLGSLNGGVLEWASDLVVFLGDLDKLGQELIVDGFMDVNS